MQTSIRRQKEKMIRRNKLRRAWKRAVKMMACVVVFCTVYALILPALTAEDEAFCGREEHVHTEECYTRTEGTRTLICTPQQLQIHQHDDSCRNAEGELICGKADYILHTHNEECYDADHNLICTLPEHEGTVHVHDGSCYRTERGSLICTLEETEGHTHSEACFDEEGNLICGQEEVPAHHHEDACYEQVRVLACGMLEVQEHVHEDACFETGEPTSELTCGKEEHTHTLECYSDPTADVESAAVWEATLPGRTGNRTADLKAVANSQMGYAESEKNYEVQPDNSLKGYTRYGAWAGDPYGDWNFYFAKFCMSYAGIPGELFESSSNSAVLRSVLQEYDRLMRPGEGEPEIGDLVFLERNDQNLTGIISAADGSHVTVILGDDDNAVRSRTFAYEASEVLGYGRMAEVLTEPEETVPETTLPATETTVPETTVPSTEPTVPETTAPSTEPTVPETTAPAPEPTVPETTAPAPEPTVPETTVPATEPTIPETTAPTPEPTVPGTTAPTPEPTVPGTTAPAPEPTVPETSEPSTEPTYGAPEDANARADLVTENRPSFHSSGLQSAPNGNSVDMTDMITNVSLQHRPNNGGQWEDVKNGQTLPESEQIKCTISYTVPRETLNQNCKTITYHAPSGLKLQKVESGIVLDHSGKKVGTYVIDETGFIQITFIDEYVTKNADQSIEGTITFEGSLNKDQAGEDGNLELVFNDQFKTTVKVTEKEAAKGDVNVTKAGEVTQDGRIRYTITITSKQGTSGTVKVTDTMTFATYFGDLKIVNQSGEAVFVNLVPEKGAESFTLELPAMQSNSKYVITYLAKPDKNTSGGHVENQVIAESVNTDNLPLEGSAAIKTAVDILRKDGVFDPDTGMITWTLMVNKQKADISGWVLKDFVTGTDGHRTEYKGEFTMKDSAGKEIKANFPYTFPKGSTDTYTITYQTEAKDTGGTAGVHSILNQAELYKNTELMYDGEKGIGIGVYEPVTKEGLLLQKAENGRLILRWKVRLNLDDLKDGLITFSDWLPAQDDIEQYMTRDQLLTARKVIEDQLSAHGLSPLDWAVFPRDSKDKWSAVKWPDSLEPDGMYKGLQYKLKAPFPSGSQLEFIYETTGIVENNTKPVSFRNEFGLDAKFTPAELPYIPDELKIEKIDPDAPSAEQSNHFFHELKNGELKWILRVYIPENMRNQDAVLTDTLPEHVELTKLVVNAGQNLQYGPTSLNFGSGTSSEGQMQVNGQGYSIIAAREGRQKITVTLPKELTNQVQGYYEVEVSAKLLDSEVQWNTDGMTQSAGFKNTASIQSGGTTASDTQIQVITKNQLHGVVSKTGTMTKESNIVPYTITVNPEGIDLVKGSDTMVLDDVLQFNTQNGKVHASLVPGSVKVYSRNPDGSQGPQLKAPYQYEPSDHETEPEQYKLHITLPDEKPVIVAYEYRFYGKVGVKTDVSNTATISAVQTDDDHNNSHVEIEVQDSGATADIRGIVLYKVDRDDQGTFLSGARFQLSKWNGSAYEVIKNSLTTNAQGQLLLIKENLGDSLAYNTAYRLEEIKAPDGYFRTAEPYDFYIANEDTTSHPDCKPGNFTGHRLKDGEQVYFGNERNETSLKIVKLWQDETGKPLTDPKCDQITVKIYRQTSGGEREFVKDVTLSLAEGWKATLDGLPGCAQNPDGTKGGEYSYSVEEILIPGFEVTYENNSGIFTGTITVTNKKETGYVLPETGGIGIFPIILAGLACVSGSAAMIFRKKNY